MGLLKMCDKVEINIPLEIMHSCACEYDAICKTQFQGKQGLLGPKLNETCPHSYSVDFWFMFDWRLDKINMLCAVSRDGARALGES